MLRQDDYQKALLVNFGYINGKEYGGHLAACAIMSCMMNRVRSGWGSIAEVIEKAGKYAAVNELPKGFPSIWDANFVRLLTEVDGVYDGHTKDLSCGGLYFCDSRRVEKDWFRDEIIRSGAYEVCMNMGSLNFYKPSHIYDSKEHISLYHD